MSDPRFILLYVKTPAVSTASCAELLGKPAAETSPNFAMSALDGGVTLSNPKAGVPEGTPQEIAEQTRSTYAGPLVVGEDMMSFRVTESGVERVPPGD